MALLLVIDDEESILHAFRRVFQGTNLTIKTAFTANTGLEEFIRSQPDVVILDVHLPDESGLELYQKLRSINARIPVIFITGHGTTDLAIEAIKRGAYDYLLKPLELGQIRTLVMQAVSVSRLMQTPAILPNTDDQSDPGDMLIGRCPEMQEIYKAIGRVAQQDVVVLIQGESGTGKELVARAIYQHSKRSQKPFLAINCAAIPETLLESELFGHEKGAFTGADRKRIGKFEQCNGGTIFLDEVGEMSSLTQAKMLRLIQEQTFERVGGNETIQTDVRLIAATNANLEKMTTEGRFRGDLFFRLNVFSIKLPPLRERGEDLQLMIDWFVNRFGRELSKPVQTITPDTFALLQKYPWRGNVRELQSVLQSAILKMRGNVLTAEDLPILMPTNDSLPKTELSGPSFDWNIFVQDRVLAGSKNLYAEALALMEREILTRVLRRTQGNQLQAANILGITRGTLRTKLKQLHIVIERSVWSEDDHDD
jgi:two-component system, NtrC family, response regulator AtoC